MVYINNMKYSVPLKKRLSVVGIVEELPKELVKLKAVKEDFCV